MKLTLTTYSKDGRYQDLRQAEFGINCPYAIKIQIKRFSLTIYRWSCPTLCISMANSDESKGGPKEDWAAWVLYQDNPWRRFKFWSAPK